MSPIHVQQTALSYLRLTDYVPADDTLDITPGLTQAIIDANAQNKWIYAPPRRYPFKSQLVTGLPVRMFGEGDRSVFSTEITNIDGSAQMLVQGSLATAYNLTANATAGQDSITVAGADITASGIAVGDVVMVRSNALWPYGLNDYSGDCHVAELAYVKSVGTTSIVFMSPLDDTYLTTDTARVQKMNPVTGSVLRGIHFENPIQGTTTVGGALFHLCRDVVLEDVSASYLDNAAFTFDVVAGFKATRPSFYRLSDDQTVGRYGYGIVARAASRNGLVTGLFMNGGRHAFTCGGGAGPIPSEGIPRHIEVSNSKATGMTNAAFDTHSPGQYIQLNDCEAYNNYAWGFQVRSVDSEVNNPIVRDSIGYGIWVRNQRVRITNPRVRNAKTGIVTSNGGSFQGQGIRTDSDDTEILFPRVNNTDEDAIYTSGNRTIIRQPITTNPGQNGQNIYHIRWAAGTGHFVDRPYAKGPGNLVIAAVTASGVLRDPIPNAGDAITVAGGPGIIDMGDAMALATQDVGLGGIFGPSFPGWIGGNGVALTSGTLYGYRIRPERTFSITQVWQTVATASSTDDPLEIAIWNASGTTKLFTSGSVSGNLNAVGDKLIPLTARLYAGTSYIVTYQALSTAQLRFVTYNSSSVLVPFGTDLAHCLMWWKSGVSTLPTPSPIGSIANVNQVPLLCLRES